MTRTPRRRSAAAAGLALVALVASAALGACGSDDRAQAVASLKAQIVANNAMQSRTRISDQQAGCVARGAVNDIGVGRLQDYRILDGDLRVEKTFDQVPLAAKDADALAGVFLRCADAERIFERSLGRRLAPKRAQARARVQRCVRRAVTTASVRRILAQSFEKKDAAAYTALSRRLARCR